MGGHNVRPIKYINFDAAVVGGVLGVYPMGR